LHITLLARSHCGVCRRSFASSSFRSRRRRRRRRREGFQELQCLSARTQFAVEQQHEHVLCNLRILRQLGRDQQFRHLRQRNFLLDLAPLCQEILDLLIHRLLPCCYRQEQDHFWTRAREQLPSPRRRGTLFTHQTLRQLLCMILDVAPCIDQILARNLLPQVSDIFVREAR